MATLGLGVDEALRTTRAVRKRLDLDRPVEREVLLECLESANQAPSGSNSQPWRWVVVTDPAKRSALADIYRAGWAAYSKRLDSGAAMNRILDSAAYLADNFHRVPAMVIPCIRRLPEGMPWFLAVSRLGSILPAAWSFMLAARERGLGTTWTTFHLLEEEAAADLLDIPYDDFAQCALITVGYTLGTDFAPAPRRPVGEVTYFDTWRNRA